MGFWQRARLVLKGDIVPRMGVAQPAAPEEALSPEQLGALEEIAQRMAAMAASIKELEARAQEMQAGPDTGAPATAAGTADETAKAQVQVEIIDELLDGVRQLRTALDLQRDELVEAERRITGDDGDEQARGVEPIG